MRIIHILKSIGLLYSLQPIRYMLEMWLLEKTVQLHTESVDPCLIIQHSSWYNWMNSCKGLVMKKTPLPPYEGDNIKCSV